MTCQLDQRHPVDTFALRYSSFRGIDKDQAVDGSPSSHLGPLHER